MNRLSSSHRIKEQPNDVHMEPVGLGNMRISIQLCPKTSPDTTGVTIPIPFTIVVFLHPVKMLMFYSVQTTNPTTVDKKIKCTVDSYSIA